MVIQLETPEETVRADASLTFSLKGKDSEMKLILYTPILTPFAKIEVSKRLATWTDESGTRSLQKQPLFKKWFSNDWWKEIAFSLGTVTEETAAFIWMNESQQPVLYHKNKRRMECEFESFETQPQVCKISDEGLTGSLNFSSVECQSPL
ncbi:MAG: hypothetical protein J0L93_01105 [Deltaproteobacteria bacterium]|nr:hypothetical protein [Deltaproteobacteria bacterium]